MNTEDRFASVWDALESPADAIRFKARAEVAHFLMSEIERRSISKKQAAALLGVTQPRICDLVRGRLDLFSLDTLVEMADRAGFSVGIRISRRRAA